MTSLLRIYASGDYGKLREVTVVKREKYIREFFADSYLWFFKKPITAEQLNSDFKQFFEHDIVPDYARRYIFDTGL